ncbi:MAG: DUF806 family protein [Lactobacillus sp.]|nr:DUF806 family protein [Lactobacillus sp.]
MKIPVIQVLELLQQAPCDWIDEFFVGSFDLGFKPDVNKTYVLLQDGVGNLGDHANDSLYSIDAVIEIQVFFSKKIQINILQAQLSLMSLLEPNGWLPTAIRPVTTDPDTQQKTATVYVRKTLRIRGN